MKGSRYPTKTINMAVKHNKIWFVRNWLTILRLLLISNSNTNVNSTSMTKDYMKYDCGERDKGSTVYSALNQHIVPIHTGDSVKLVQAVKQNHCTDCETIQEANNNLSDHVKLLQEGRLNHCTDCEIMSWRLDAFKPHIIAMHEHAAQEANKNPCISCKERFRTLSTITLHISSNHVVNQNHCNVCDKYFMRPATPISRISASRVYITLQWSYAVSVNRLAHITHGNNKTGYRITSWNCGRALLLRTEAVSYTHLTLPTKA